jgi:LacI family transcriptional regulator, repressor for deo operon, udp, cdd, tsx, nupC, and nupG
VAKFKKVTITDIARIAQVSISTVSRVLTESSGVNDEVREKVRAIALEMGYEPPIRTETRRPTSKAIAFLVESSDVFVNGAPFFGKFLAGVHQVFETMEYQVILSTTRREVNPKQQISEMGESGIAGFILAQTQMDDPFVKELQDLQYPFVTLGRAIAFLNTPYVDVDSFGGAHSAVSALASRGHQHIAHISGKLNTLAAMARLEGYRKALQDYNLRYDERYTVEGNESQQEAYDATMKLLDQTNPTPTGIFVYNDFLAVGVLSALHDRGIRVPDDVSLIGFDDDDSSVFAVPPLASVCWPVVEMGKQAAEMLLVLLSGQLLQHRQVVLPTEVIERESLGKLLKFRDDVAL